MNNEIYELQEKYFSDRRTIYPIVSDMHKNLEGEFYIRWRMDGDRAEIYAGSDNGEVCICVSRSAERLERVLLALLN